MARIDRESQEVYLLALHDCLRRLRAERERLEPSIMAYQGWTPEVTKVQAQIDALELVAFAIEADQPVWIANSFALSGHESLDPLSRLRRERGEPRNGVIKESYE